MSAIRAANFEIKIRDLFVKTGITAFRLRSHFTPTLMGYSTGGSVQIDIIARSGNVVILIDPTLQQSNLPAYTRGKVSNIDRIWNSPNGFVGALQQSPRDFGLTVAEAQLFASVSDYRHLIVGPYVKDSLRTALSSPCPKLYFWDGETLAYFERLVKALEKYSEGEVLNSIGLRSQQLAQWASYTGTIDCQSIRTPGVRTFKSGVSAEVYIFTISPKNLLHLATVRRLEAPSELAYQRLPDHSRLPKIAKYIVNSEIKFLNNLIVTLPENVDYSNNMLKILKVPFSCGIIDGQHRLYAYTKAPSRHREQDVLIVTGIKFILSSNPQTRKEELGRTLKDEARIFLNINAEQKKASPKIIHGVRTFVLEEDRKETHALMILKRLNQLSRTKHAFSIKTFLPGIPTPSLLRNHFGIHFDSKINLSKGRGVILHHYQGHVFLRSGVKDYSRFYDEVTTDLYDFLRRALDAMNFPSDWSKQPSYRSFACVGGILRSFRYFRNEPYYWRHRGRIDQVFTEVIRRHGAIPAIYSILPRGGRGPKQFESMIIRSACRIHRRRRPSWVP